MTWAYLSIGSNLGDRLYYLREALEHLEAHGVIVNSRSGIYETDPVGVTPKPVPHYLNAVIGVEWNGTPADLLKVCQQVEFECGRQPTFRWGPRTLDIDLLLFDNETAHTDFVEVPHPRLTERAFVLIPLLELNPDLTLPNGCLVRPFLDDERLRQQEVRPYGCHW